MDPEPNNFPQMFLRKKCFKLFLDRCTVFVFLCSCYLSVDGSQTSHCMCIFLIHHYWSVLIISQTTLWWNTASHIQHPLGQDHTNTSDSQEKQPTWCKKKKSEFIKLGPLYKTVLFCPISFLGIYLGDKYIGICTIQSQRGKRTGLEEKRTQVKSYLARH